MTMIWLINYNFVVLCISHAKILVGIYCIANKVYSLVPMNQLALQLYNNNFSLVCIFDHDHILGWTIPTTTTRRWRWWWPCTQYITMYSITNTKYGVNDFESIAKMYFKKSRSLFLFQVHLFKITSMASPKPRKKQRVGVRLVIANHKELFTSFMSSM